MFKRTAFFLTLFSSLAGSVNAQQISAIVPNSAPQGTTGQTVTFTLGGMVPPTEVPPVSVTLGTLVGTSVSRPSQFMLTAVFDIPFAEATGTKDAVITFPSPMGMIDFSLPAGFSVTAGADTPPSVTKQPLDRFRPTIPRSCRFGTCLARTPCPGPASWTGATRSSAPPTCQVREARCITASW